MIFEKFPFSLKLVVTVLFISYFSSLFVAVLYYYFDNVSRLNVEIVYQLCFLTVLLFFLYKNKNSINAFNFGFFCPSYLLCLYGFLICIALIVVDYFLFYGFYDLKQFSFYIKNQRIPNSWLLYFVSSVVLAPVVEEVAFRGLLLPALVKRFPRPYFPIFLVSLLWTFDHSTAESFYVFLGIFITGCFLGFMRWRYNNLLICIYTHATLNLFWFFIFLMLS